MISGRASAPFLNLLTVLGPVAGKGPVGIVPATFE